MTAEEVKQLLHLEPLAIEGGFFRETYRSRWNVSSEYLPDGFPGLTFHRYRDLLHDHAGDIFRAAPSSWNGGLPLLLSAIRLSCCSCAPTAVRPPGHALVPTWSKGHQPQVVVRGHVWQGCRLAPGGKWALMGTTMSPGFDYADYEIGDREQLCGQYPAMSELISEYTK